MAESLFEIIPYFDNNGDMKKSLWVLGIISFFWGNTFALEKEPLRAESSVVVENGSVKTTAILSDIDGYIFIEFLKDLYVVISGTEVGFRGEIIAPEIIEIPQRAPRARMKEILTFELLTDTGDGVTFLDRFTLMHSKHKVREQLENPEMNLQRQGGLLLAKFSEEDQVQVPVLWEYRSDIESISGSCHEQNGEEQSLCLSVKSCKSLPEYEKAKCLKKLSWRKIGGKVEQSPDGETIFSVILTRNGIFTIFDENPPIDFTPTFPVDEIEYADPSPYPSVEPSAEIINIGGTGTPLGVEATEENPLTTIPAVEAPNLTEIPPFIEPDVVEEELISAKENPIEDTTTQTLTEAEVLAELEAIQNQNEAATATTQISEGATLPQSGQKTDLKFPIVLLFALGILGASGYLAFRSKRY